MFNLEVVKKRHEVEVKSGTSVTKLLTQVPFGNVVTSFKHIPIPDLVEMVMGVTPTKLVRGLTIISPNEISQVPYDKLKLVLFHGNMETVARLQETLSEAFIINALKSMSHDELKSLLMGDDFLTISDRILELNGVVNG